MLIIQAKTIRHIICSSDRQHVYWNMIKIPLAAPSQRVALISTARVALLAWLIVKPGIQLREASSDRKAMEASPLEASPKDGAAATLGQSSHQNAAQASLESLELTLYTLLLLLPTSMAQAGKG